MNEAQRMASHPGTLEMQRRFRVEMVVQEIMRNLSADGIHSGTVLDEDSLEGIAGAFRAAISKAGLENGICLRCGINQNPHIKSETF